MTGRGVMLWNIAYVVVGAAIATAVAWPIYESPRVVVIGVVSVVVAGAIVLLVRRAWLIAALAFAAYLLLVVPLAIPAGLGSFDRVLRALRDGLFGIVLGWKQLLTLSLPLGEYQAVLVPLFVVLLGGTVLALALAVRGGRAAPAAVVVVAAMTLFGIAFGSSATSAPLGALPAPREIALALVLVVVSLAWLLGRARLARVQALRIAQASTAGVRQGPQSFWRTARRRILAGILLVAALAGGLAVAPIASALSPRQALRDDIDPLLVLRDQPSPLAAYRSWFLGAAYDSELFTVSGDLGAVDRLRIATLDSYDGQVFEVGAATPFHRVPQTAPSPGSSALTITIGEGFTGPWVPVPTGISAAPTFSGPRADLLADGYYASDATALETALTPGVGYGLRPGDSYSLYATPAGADASLSAARGGDSLIPVDDYPALAEWVELQEVPRTGEGLIRLISLLTQRGYLSHSLTDDAASTAWIDALSARAPYAFQASYAGHSSARVEELFADLTAQQVRAGEGAPDELLISAVGDDEQFATAAALLSRYFGFDSRVVVGVRLAGEADDSVEACREGVCAGSNVTAWAEARTQEGSWVPLEASPQFSVAPTTIAVGEQLPENPTVPDQASTTVVDPPVAQRDDSPGADAPLPPEPTWLDAVLPIAAKVGMGTLGVLLLLLPALVLFFAKSRRRRSRRDADEPEVSIVGAWDELVDSYVDHGLDVARSSTRGDVAQRIGRPAVLELVRAVDRAVFAERQADSAARDRAWQLVDGERHALRRASTRMEAVRAALSPASFLRQLAPGSRTRENS